MNFPIPAIYIKGEQQTANKLKNQWQVGLEFETTTTRSATDFQKSPKWNEWNKMKSDEAQRLPKMNESQIITRTHKFQKSPLSKNEVKWSLMRPSNRSKRFRPFKTLQLQQCISMLIYVDILANLGDGGPGWVRGGGDNRWWWWLMIKDAGWWWRRW